MNIKSWFTPPEGPIDMEALTEKFRRHWNAVKRQLLGGILGFL